MNRSILAPLAFPILLLSLSAPVSAEERLELTHTPDLSMYEAVLPGGLRWKRYRSGSRSNDGTSAAWSLGAGVGSSDGESGGIGAGTLALGWRSPILIIGGRSEFTGFISAEGDGFDLSTSRGHHDVFAAAHLGDRRDDYGIHFTLDGTARHSGGQPFRLDAPRYGTAPLKTMNGAVGATLRFGDDELALAVPVSYRGEETRWDAGPLRSATGQKFSLGLGVMPNTKDAVRGTIDLIRAEVEHTRFGSRAVLSSAVLSSADVADVADDGFIADEYRKVTVAGGVKEVTFYDRTDLGTFDFHIGYSWLESDVGAETIKAGGVDFKLGTNLQFGKPGDSSRFGFAVARDPNRSADGSRLLSEWRLEISSEHDRDHTEIGVRGGLSWLSSKAGASTGDSDATGTLIRYGTQLDAFYKLPLNFQAGGYLATSYEPQRTIDPFSVDRTWGTEAGLLLRWKRNALAKPQPKPKHDRHHREERRPVRVIAH